MFTLKTKYAWCFALGFVALPMTAMAQGIESGIEASGDVSSQFAQLYEIIAPSGKASGLVTAIRDFTFIFFLFSVIWYLRKIIAQVVREKQLTELWRFLIMVIILGILLGPVGKTPPAMLVAKGFLTVKDNFIRSSLALEAKGLSIDAAIQDATRKVDGGAFLRAKATACDVLPVEPTALPATDVSGVPLTREQEQFQEKINCYENLQKDIDAYLVAHGGAEANPQLAAAGGALDGAILRINNENFEGVSDLNDFFNEYVGDALYATVIWFALLIHRIWLFILHGSYFLAILILPFTILFSVAPFTSGSPMANWIGGFIGLMLTEFFYVVLVALSALIQISAATSTAGQADVTNALLIGVFAPLMAASMAKFNTSAGIAGATAGIAGITAAIPVVGGAVSSWSRWRK